MSTSPVSALREIFKRPSLAWGIVLLLALWLRWPLPEPQWQHVDEQAFVDYPLGFWGGDLNPHFFNYPTFHLYLLSALYYLYFLLFSRETLDTFVAYRYFADGHDLLAIARGVNTLLALGTVGVTLCLGRRLYGRQGAWIAGLTLALMPLHVRFAHLAITDVPAAFWCSLALLWALRLLQEERRHDYLLAGVFVGLAGATKYPAALVALPVLAAAWRRSPRLALHTGAVSLCCFALTTPYVWLDYPHFWSAFSTMGQEHLLDSGHHGGDPSWLHLIRYHLRYGLGLGGMATLLVALAWKPRAWRFEEGVVAACLAVFAALLAASQSTFMRYALPLAVPLALLVVRPILGLSGRLEPGRARLVLAGWLVVLLAEPAYNSLQTRLLLSGPDTRTQARQWLAAHPGTTRVIQASGRAEDVGILTPTWVYARQNRFANSFSADRLQQAYALLGQRQDLPPLYQSLSLEEAGSWVASESDTAASEALLLWCNHPLCQNREEVPPLLEQHLRWQTAFSPGAVSEMVFDQADWYFVPIGGWAAATCSGPAFRAGLVPLRLNNPTPSAQAFFQLLDHLLSANQAAKGKDWTGALEHYRQVFETPFYLRELFTYAFLYGMYMEAGTLYQDQGNPAMAISCWLGAAETRPDLPDPPYRIALAYSAQEEPAKALPYFRQAIERDDQNPKFYYNLGIICLQLDLPAEAIAAFEACVARKPNADAYLNLGVLYRSAGQRERSTTCYRKVLELVPDHPQAAVIRKVLQAGP